MIVLIRNSHGEYEFHPMLGSRPRERVSGHVLTPLALIGRRLSRIVIGRDAQLVV